MRLHRFYIKNPIEGKIIKISDERLIHQWRNVFRYNTGSQVILFDGSGKEFEVIIEKISNREAEVRIISEKKGVLPKKEIILYQSLIKKDNLEWVVQKATELGVSKIVPIISEHSEKKGFNLERAQKIAIEASEQCGRSDVPEISEVMNYESCIMNYGKDAFIFDSSGKSFHDSNFKLHTSLSIFIGPEGGWSEKEIEMFKNAGAKIFSLGDLTLRAETAAIVALAALKFLD